jgi:hypothetical protein
MTAIIILIIGYSASVLLAISLLVNNDLKFRWLNTWGCIAFIVYGILIQAFPIILTNSILLLINLYYLIKIYRAHEDFELIEFKGEEKLVHKFLSFHQADIQAYFPGYRKEEAGNNINFVVLRDLVIANMFVAELEEDGTAIVKINYTVPRYRDYKVGKFIFDRENKYLVSKGVRRLIYQQVVNKKHEKFIQVMGFKKEKISDNLVYVKQLL